MSGWCPRATRALILLTWLSSILAVYMAYTHGCIGANTGSAHEMQSIGCRGYRSMIRPYVQLIGDRLEAGRRIVYCRGKLRGLSELMSLENEDAYDASCVHKKRERSAATQHCIVSGRSWLRHLEPVRCWQRARTRCLPRAPL